MVSSLLLIRNRTLQRIGYDLEHLDAGKQLNLLGKNALNEIDFQAENATELKAEVKKNYFEKALEIANKAKALPEANSQIDNLIDDINYSLENYFN